MTYKFSKYYNIIVLKQNKIYNYYIKKQGYGDLLFIFGLSEKIKPSDFEESYIIKYIIDAENRNFWGVEA